MAAPEGGAVLCIPKRYLVAGAFALFALAGVPPDDVAAVVPPIQRQAVVVPRYPPPPPTTFVRQGYVEAAASVEDPTPGNLVRTQVIPPYKGPNWVTLPQITIPAVSLLPEADQHLDIPVFRYRPNTGFITPGARPILSVVSPDDELASSRRSIVQPPYPKYRGDGFFTTKSADAVADLPAESGALVVALPRLYSAASLVQLGRIPPPDVTAVVPINDRIRVVSAIYPYQGKSFVQTTPWLLVETPSEYGTILIPSQAKSWPNNSNTSWIQRQGPPPATVTIAQDEEAWASRRSIVVPTRPYGAGQFLTAKVPPANVVIAQDEEAWTSRRSINLKDYSALWANPALTRAFIKQIEEDLSLRPGNRAIVIPTQPYQPGQVRYGFIARPNVVVTVDELLASRRVVSLAEWRQKYFDGDSFIWTPRPDNIIVPVVFACISVEEGPITMCTVTEGPLIIVTVEVEC